MDKQKNSKMLHIVVEKSMGFGGGGWDVGYYIHFIRNGKVVKTIRHHDDEPVMTTLKFMLKEFDIEHTIHKVNYPPKNANFCKQLIKALRKETR